MDKQVKTVSTQIRKISEERKRAETGEGGKKYNEFPSC